MAIDTYAKLQSEILDTLNRGDLVADVTKYSPGPIEGAVKRAIRRCEIRLQRTLRVRQMEASTTITLGSTSQSYPVPSDFLASRLIFLEQDPVVVLQQTTLEDLYSQYPSQAKQQPEKVALVGSDYYFRPWPDGAYSVKIFYYQQITPLSDTNTSNWLLLSCPDAYLYGACVELMPHLMDDARIQVWAAIYKEAVTQITGDDDATKYTGVLQQSVLPVQIVV